MKLYKLIQRISAAAVAGALTLSLCAPVLAEAPPIGAVHLPQLTRSSMDEQNDDGQFRNLGSITFGGQTYDIAAIPNGTISIANQGTTGRDLLPAYNRSYDGSTLTFTLKDGQSPLSDAVITFSSDYSTNLVITGGSSSPLGSGVVITGAADVTIDGSNKEYAVSGRLIVSCSGALKIIGGNHSAVSGALNVEASGSVEVTGNCSQYLIGSGDITSSGKVSLGCDSGYILTSGTLTYTPDLNGTGYNGYKILDYSNDESNPVDVTDLTQQQGETLSPYTYTDDASYLQFVPVKMHTVTVEHGIASAKNVQGSKNIRLYEGLAVTVNHDSLFNDNPYERSWVGWKSEDVDFTSNENFVGTFTMPDKDVKITPDIRYTVQIESEYNPLTDAAGNIQYFVPDTTVTLPADFDPNTDPTKKLTGWTVTRGYTSQSISVTLDSNGNYTFNMPDTFVVAVPQYVDLYTVTVEGGTASSDDANGTSISAAVGSTVKLNAVADASGLPGQVFSYWEVVYPENVTKKLDFDTSKADASFTMPDYPVKLIARWTVNASKPEPDDADHQLDKVDESFGVEPIAPADTGSGIGGALAAAAVGGAAVLGGYEVVTRVMLHNLLPEGAAIPANRSQLALLVWNTAGRPAPVNTPAFADVADPDTASAAQWCVEQGVLDARADSTFDPDGWTPKYRVLLTWNKAFPQK